MSDALVHLLFDIADGALSQNVTTALGPVEKGRSPLLTEAQPWDVAWLNTYPTVAFDNGVYKLWYNAVVDCGTDANSSRCLLSTAYRYPASMAHQAPHKRTATLYAESPDGLAWSTPRLGLVPWGSNGSTANNIVLDSGEADNNRGILVDRDELNASRRFKAFGSFAIGHMGTMVSADGLRWYGHASADAMGVHGDTANQITYDHALGRYVAFTRIDCHNASCGEHKLGTRREARSLTLGRRHDSGWSHAEEVAHGGAWQADEFYSMAPWRSPRWRPGLLLAVASFYNGTLPATDGRVRCELVHSTDHGASWARVATAHTEIIPLGARDAFDSHTCYAAPPIAHPSDPAVTLLYYAGGNGPHSGRRADSLGLARATTDALAGKRSMGDGAQLVSRPLDLREISRGDACLRVLVHARALNDHAIGHAQILKVSVVDVSGRVLWRAEARLPPSVRPRWITARRSVSPHSPRLSLLLERETHVRVHLELAEGMTAYALEACGSSSSSAYPAPPSPTSAAVR